MRFTTALRIAGACLVLGVMAACGGGGSSGGGAHAPDGTGDSGLSGRRPPGPGTISGIAHDGPISGATINVYEWNGQRGQLLGSTTTDSDGRYSLSLRVPRQPVLLEAVGGVYVDEASETKVTVPSGQSLLAVQNFDLGQATTSNLTYYSTLASGLAENLVKQGSPAEDAVTTANMRIADILGLDLSKAPAVVNNRLGAADANTSVELGFATAAVSLLTQSMSIASDSPSTTLTSIAFIQAALDDIRADGMLDGKGANGPITLGKIRMSPDIYRRQLALNILKAGTNPTANRLQFNAAQLVPLATRLNNSTDPIFANAPTTPIDTTKPNIVDVSVADGDVFFGNGRKIFFSIQSLAALTNVQLLLNSTVAIDMADPNAMIASLNTTRFTDGQFDFTLVATDAAGASVRKSFTITVANNTATVVSNTLKADQFYNGVFDAQFSINDPAGIGQVQYLVDDVIQQTQATTAPFHFDTRKFADGRHTVTVQVTAQTINNMPGAVTATTISINIDNTPPTATFSLADNTFTNQGVLNLMISATDAVFNAPRLPDVANVASFLLDGKNNPTPPTDISVVDNGVTFNQSLSAIPEGVHTFSFTVSDAINTTVVSRKFTIDRTPPVIAITVSTRTNPDMVTCKVTFRDALSPLVSATQLIFAGGFMPETKDLLPLLSPDGSFSVDSPGTKPDCIFEAADAAGNTRRMGP